MKFRFLFNIKNIKKFNIIYIILICIIILIIRILFRNIIKKYNLGIYCLDSSKFIEDKLDYENNKFIILKDLKCSKFCGLLSFYFHYLGCINIYLMKGYIPIVDLQSFPNIFNGYNLNNLKKNPWELFFEQPFGYRLKNVIKYSKYVEYSSIKHCYKFHAHSIYNNTALLDYYHTIASKYIPIKKEIIKESNDIMINLFKGSKNILGIFTRGTDYIYARPKGHPIPPTVEMVSYDIKKMNEKYNYDYYFLSTEDDTISSKLINEFGVKMKYLKPKKGIEYNYTKKEFLFQNKNLYNNINLNKVYIISVFILSKCIDIISARTGGALILFIFNEGFRNKKVYYLGDY